MTNVVALTRPPSDLAPMLREMADKCDAGEITDMVIASIDGGSYEFTYSASLSGCVVLATLLLQNCIDRMRR